jgi:tRNA(fMet)-specific endonuclease VapC
MRLLPDTSAYSAATRGHSEIKRVLRFADEIHVSPVMLGELKAGFRRGSRRQQNEQDLNTFQDSTRVSHLQIDGDTAECYAEILADLRKAGTPVPTNDVWIAASAMQYGLRVVTADAHFRLIPQILVDYFEV